MKKSPLESINLVAQTIYDKKGFNILALDVRGLSIITDYLIIAEGSVDRHVTAIGKAIVDELDKQGEDPIHVEGFQTGDWVVLDYTDFIVHIFMPGFREKYSLERLWKESQIVDLKIDVSTAQGFST